MFLKNRNINSKIKRSKVTDYAALNCHNDISSKIGGLKIGLSLHLHKDLVYASIESSGKPVHLRRLVSGVPNLKFWLI